MKRIKKKIPTSEELKERLNNMSDSEKDEFKNKLLKMLKGFGFDTSKIDCEVKK